MESGLSHKSLARSISSTFVLCSFLFHCFDAFFIHLRVDLTFIVLRLDFLSPFIIILVLHVFTTDDFSESGLPISNLSIREPAKELRWGLGSCRKRHTSTVGFPCELRLDRSFLRTLLVHVLRSRIYKIGWSPAVLVVLWRIIGFFRRIWTSALLFGSGQRADPPGCKRPPSPFLVVPTLRP